MAASRAKKRQHELQALVDLPRTSADCRLRWSCWSVVKHDGKPGHARRRGRTGQAAKTHVVVLVAGLHVEARQPQRRASRVRGRNHPRRFLVRKAKTAGTSSPAGTPGPRRRSPCRKGCPTRPRIRWPTSTAGQCSRPGHRRPSPGKSARHCTCSCSSRQPKFPSRPSDVGVDTRDAITIAKNPHTRFPSVNIVGRMAKVRMGRMG